MARVGANGPATREATRPLLEGMRELGYAEGENVEYLSSTVAALPHGQLTKKVYHTALVGGQWPTVTMRELNITKALV